MPLLSPQQIHQVLKEETRSQLAGKPKTDLPALLEKHNLTPDDLLDKLSSEIVSGDSSSARQRAIETGLKLNRLLNSDDTGTNFSVTINISDSEFGNTVNPILVPRGI